MRAKGTRIRGNWLKISHVYFGVNWHKWTVGLEVCKDLRQSQWVIGPFYITFNHERWEEVDLSRVIMDARFKIHDVDSLDHGD